MSESRYNPAHKAVIDDLVHGMPGVKAGKAFGYPAYKINGKVFAFVGQNGVSMKFTEERAQELRDEHPILQIFQPAEGLSWKAWVTLRHDDSEILRQYEHLLVEAAEFVGGL